MTEQRHTRVKRVEAVGSEKARTIQAEFGVSSNITNVWALTPGEARQLGLQLLDVVGATEEMREAFIDGWHQAEDARIVDGVKHSRVHHGLRTMFRSKP